MSMTGIERGVCCTYILRCADGTLYTGWTNDLEHRLQSHNAGTGGKYTRTHRPVTLAWYEIHDDRSAAMHREAEIKRLTRAQKLQLMEREGIKP